MEIRIQDCRHFSAEEIIKAIMNRHTWLKKKENRCYVYIGATKDIKDRLRRHKATKILFCAQTANRRVASKVEEVANRLGFNIGDVSWGGNGTNSYSIYVYAYMIDKNTRQ